MRLHFEPATYASGKGGTAVPEAGLLGCHKRTHQWDSDDLRLTWCRYHPQRSAILPGVQLRALSREIPVPAGLHWDPVLGVQTRAVLFPGEMRHTMRRHRAERSGDGLRDRRGGVRVAHPQFRAFKVRPPPLPALPSGPRSCDLLASKKASGSTTVALAAVCRRLPSLSVGVTYVAAQSRVLRDAFRPIGL